MVNKNTLITDCLHLSLHHMNLAHLMRNHGQFKTTLILCNWALASMIRAFYICENCKNLSDTEIMLIKITPPIDLNPSLELDTMVFVNTLDALISDQEIDIEIMECKEVDELLHKTEKVVVELSVRIMNLLKTEMDNCFNINIDCEESKLIIFSQIELPQQKYREKTVKRSEISPIDRLT
ncbi:hypothetical protein [Paenibacillus sp. TH7-28]